MSELETEGVRITDVRPAGLDALTVEFASPHAGHHQLYVNGRLADWTEAPGQRAFSVGAAGTSLVTVAAVSGAERRWEDLSHLLAEGFVQCGWVYRASFPRATSLPRGTVASVECLDSEGRSSELSREEVWPARLGRWAFGEDGFGVGGFGFGGAGGCGMHGAFGAGMFGIGAEAAAIETMLPANARQVTVRLAGPQGQTTDVEQVEVSPAAPPRAACGMSVAAYDAARGILTLQIERN